MRVGPPSRNLLLLYLFDSDVDFSQIVKGYTSEETLEDWGAMLGGDTAATSSLLDRFLHNSEVTFIRGKSCRLWERQQREKKKSTANKPPANREYTEPTSPWQRRWVTDFAEGPESAISGPSGAVPRGFAAANRLSLRGTMATAKTRDRTKDVPSQEGHLDRSRPALIIPLLLGASRIYPAAVPATNENPSSNNFLRVNYAIPLRSHRRYSP